MSMIEIYDDVIERVKRLHGEALMEWFTCEPENLSKPILSMHCDTIKAVLDMLIKIKENYENNLRNTPG